MMHVRSMLSVRVARWRRGRRVVHMIARRGMDLVVPTRRHGSLQQRRRAEHEGQSQADQPPHAASHEKSLPPPGAGVK